MAHTIGTLPSRSTAQTGNPITFSQAVVAGETVFVLMLKIDGNTTRAGGAPTWGEYTFTQADQTRGVTEALAELWYIVNPLAQTKTVTIPNTGGLTIYYQVAMAKAKGGGHSAFDVAVGASTTGTNPSPGALTPSTAGSAIFAMYAGGHQDVTTGTPSQTNISQNDDGNHGSCYQYAMQAAIAAITMSWTHGTSDDYGAIAAAFREIPPNAVENYHNVKADSGMSVSK